MSFFSLGEVTVLVLIQMKKKITNRHWWSIYCRNKQSNLSGLCCRLFALLFSQVPERRGWKPSAQIWFRLPVLSSRKPNTQVSQSHSRNYSLFIYRAMIFFFFFSDLANVLRHCHSSLVLCSKRLGLFFCISCLDVFKLSSTGSSALSPQGLFPLPFHFLRVCKREEDWVALWWNVEMWGWIPDTLLALLPVLRDLSGWLTFSWECLQIVCSSVGESS